MNKYLLILVCTICLHIISINIYAQNRDTIYSKDFNLSENNTPEKNGEALEKICKYIVTHPDTDIEISKGIYRIKREISNQIWFKDCKNITFNGNGSEFIFMETEKKLSGNFFRLENVENFKLKNLIIDWDWDLAPLSVIAQIEKVDEGGIFFKLHKGIKTLPKIHMGREWDIETNARSLKGFALYSGYATDARKIDNEHIFVRMKKPETLKTTHIGKYTHIRFHHNYFAGAVYITGSTNVILESISIYSCPETAISCYATTGLVVSGCSIMPRPDSGQFYSAHSAGEIHNCFGEIMYKNNRIFYSYDDGLHISSGFLPPYLKKDKENVKKITSQYLQHYFLKDVIRTGDTFEFYDSDFKPTNFKTKLIDAKWKFGVRNHSAPNDCDLIFDKEIPDSLIENHYLFNLALTDVSYKIEGNEFAYNGCHGIHGGLPNGTIKDNKFYRTAYPPINMTLVLRWGRWVIGPGPDNIKIQNNYIDECNMAKRQPACLFVGAGIDPQNGNFKPVNYTAIQNVEISKNTIKNSDMPALGIWSIRNVIIKDNIFENVARDPVVAVKDKGAIFVEQAEDITIDSNTLIQPKAIENQQLWIDKNSTKNININNWKVTILNEEEE